MPADPKSAQLDRSHPRSGPYYCRTSGMAKRVCDCRSCVGARNRRKGKVRQRQARKALGIDVATTAAGGNEETWGGAVRVEAKAGKQVGPIRTRFLAAESQSEAGRAIGDTRPFVMTAMPDDFGSDGLVIFRLSKVREILQAIADGGK